MLLAVALVLVAGAVAAVAATRGDGGGTPVRAVAGVGVTFVAAPRGAFFDDPTWDAARRSLVVTVVREGRNASHLYELDVGGGGALQRVPLPSERGCGATSQQFGSFLPDGRLAFVQYCLGNGDRPERAVTLQAFDPRTGETRRLVPYFLPYFVGRYSFDGRMRRGVINDGRGLSERLAWLRPDRLERIPLPWGRVGQPSWSPDGRTIAVDAVEDPDGPRAPAARRTLYLLDARGRPQRALLHDLEGVRRAAWSPDGRWLAVSLAPRDGPRGLYLVSVARGSLHLLRRGDYGIATWLPDGRTLLAALGPEARRRGLERLTLPDLSKLGAGP